MNPNEPTELPPPSAGQSVEAYLARQETQRKRNRWIIPGVAVLAALVIAAAIGNNDDDERSDRVAASTNDVGTGDADVDEQIVDAVWAQNKDEICPSFNELKATMPSMSDEEILDMGMGMADMSALTPAQIEHLRHLALTDC